MKRRERQKRDAPAAVDPVRSVKVPELMAWLESLKTERPEDRDRIDEVLDIIADYEAAKDIESMAAEVVRISARRGEKYEVMDEIQTGAVSRTDGDHDVALAGGRS